MNLEDVNKLLDAGFSAAFIERIMTPEAPAAPAATAAPATPAAPAAPATPATPAAPATPATPAAPSAPEATTAPVTPAAPEAPTNPDLAALNQKIAELIGAVQQHNILTISRETPPQSPGEIAEEYLTNLINGGVNK